MTEIPSFVPLALDRLRELGQIAFSAHEDMERWREAPLGIIERTMLSEKLKSAIEEQHKWILAIEEACE